MALLKYLTLKRHDTGNEYLFRMFAWFQWSTGDYNAYSGSITAANSSVAKSLKKQQKQTEIKRLCGEYRI